jgi:hypothetical protein
LPLLNIHNQKLNKQLQILFFFPFIKSKKNL